MAREKTCNTCPLRPPTEVEYAKGIIKMTMSVSQQDFEAIVAEARTEGRDLHFDKKTSEADLLELNRRILIQTWGNILERRDSPICSDMAARCQKAIDEAKKEGIDLTPRKEMPLEGVRDLIQRIENVIRREEGMDPQKGLEK